MTIPRSFRAPLLDMAPMPLFDTVIAFIANALDQFINHVS